MADLKISQLNPATTPLSGTELTPIVQGGSTKKAAVSAIAQIALDAVGADWTAYTPTLSADSGSWGAATVNLARYKQDGKTLTIALNVTSSVASGTPSELRISLPSGLTAKSNAIVAMASVYRDGSIVVGYIDSTANASYVSGKILAGTTTFAGLTNVTGTAVIELT